MSSMWEAVQRVPEVQTEMTVRAFSGTLRRISGGVEVACSDPLTVSATAVAAILVVDREVSEIIVGVGASAM